MCLVILHGFCRPLIFFFSKLFFSEISFRNIIPSVSISLDPDQVGYFVWQAPNNTIILLFIYLLRDSLDKPISTVPFDWEKIKDLSLRDVS